MKRISVIWAGLMAVLLVQAPAPSLANCEFESLPEFPGVTITSVTRETQFAPHCRVTGVIGPEIRFELLLPDDWNGKFAMGGGGGFAGTIVNWVRDVSGAVQRGYATVGTDTGHPGHALDASWALDNLERLENFGHQAVHRTAVTLGAAVLFDRSAGTPVACTAFKRNVD